MADDLRIILQTKIDQSQKSISDLNNQISQLAAKLNKLDLKINIDEKFTSTLNNFINTFNQITQRTNDALSNQVKIVNDETKAINSATEAQKKWNAEKEKTVKDGTGKPLSTTTTYGNNVDNSKQIVNSLPDGSIRQITDMSNMKKDVEDAIKAQNKMLDEAYKMNENFDKQAEALDKAHYQALKTNQDRIEAQDKMHYMALKQNREIDLKEQQAFQKQAEAIDKAHYQALKTNQDRADAEDKQHYLALQQNQKREEDYLKQKSSLETNILDAQRRYAGDPNVGRLNDVFASAQSITSIANYKKAVSDVELELKKVTSTMATAKSNSLSFGEAFSTAMSRFPIWMAASTLFFQSLHFFTEGISYVNDFNATLTQIGTAVNYNQDKLASLGKQFQQLGKEVSASTKDIAAGALEFYRQGLGDDDVINRLKLTTQYAKISGLDFKQSAELLTAGSTSMHTDITKVADVFTLLGKQYCPLTA